MVGARRRVELMVMPEDDAAAIAQPARVRQLLSRWLDPDDAEIERAVVYTFHSVIARQWWAGPLLLAGDACHQTPPFLGQGMCAGIRDVANLAWKLSRVLDGRAASDLLASYQSERSFHVRHYIEHAIRLGAIIQATDSTVAAERDASLSLSPRTIASIKPPLGPGLHGSAPPPAGTRCRQLTLADGRRLDDVVGTGFTLLCRQALAGQADAEIERCGLRGETALLLDGDAAVDAYLRELGAAAAMVRPDRYILGVASGAGELRAMLGALHLLGGLRG
jgi:3-(3-hydroxy-phenyl)propionate hydroxylase